MYVACTLYVCHSNHYHLLIIISLNTLAVDECYTPCPCSKPIKYYTDIFMTAIHINFDALMLTVCLLSRYFAACSLVVGCSIDLGCLKCLLNFIFTPK